MRASAGALLLGVFAVMFGLLGAYVIRKELHKPNYIAVAKDNKPTTQTVPVASVDLEPGRVVKFGDIAIEKLTPAQMKARGFDDAYMANTKQIIGRVLKVAVREGSTFDTPDFYPEGTGPSVAERLKKGYRAVTVSVDQDSAVAGFAIPGSIVDVIFRADTVKETDTRSRDDDDLPETTVTLIEAAEVLAFNQETAQVLKTNDPKNPTPQAAKASVTLAVTPRQAASLRVVDGRGSMSLALRNKDDLEMGPGDISPRTLDELLDRSNNKHKIEIYRGRQLSQTSFKNNERTGTTSSGPIAGELPPTSVPVPQTAHNQPAPGNNGNNVIIVNPVRGASFTTGGVND